MVEPLKDAGKGVSGGFRRGRLRSVLVVVEVALSLLLLVGAGLLMRSFVALRTRRSRLQSRQHPRRAAAAAARPVHDRGGEAALLPDRCSTAFRRCPASSPRPRRRRCRRMAASAPTSRSPARRTPRSGEAIFQLCSEGYFQTLGLRLSRGRTFSAAEVNGARKVAVVNQTLVTRYFGQEDPIGQRIKLSMLETFRDGPGRGSRVRHHRRDVGREEPGHRGAGRRPRCSFPTR